MNTSKKLWSKDASLYGEKTCAGFGVIQLGARNNNNKKTRVLNTVLNTVRIVKSISVKPENCNTLKRFMAFCEREHISFSDGVLWAMDEFLKVHTPPNPQPTLDRMFNLGMPAKPNTLCFVAGCRRKSVFRLVLQDFEGRTELFNVCAKHKRWRHPRFRFIVRLKTLFSGGTRSTNSIIMRCQHRN